MDNKEDIGRMFKEQLSDFNRSPEKTVWKDIEGELNKEVKPKPLFWYKSASRLIIISIFIVIGIITFNNNIPNIIKLTHTNSNEIQDINCKEKISENNASSEVTIYNQDNKATQTINPETLLNTSILNEDKKKKEKWKKYYKPLTYNYLNTQYPIKNNSDAIPKREISNKLSKSAINKSDVITKQKTDNRISNRDDKISKNENNQNHTENFSDPAKSYYNIIQPPNSETITSNAVNKDIPKKNIVSDSLEKHKTQKEIYAKKVKPTIASKKDTLINDKPLEKKDIQRFSLSFHVIPTYITPANGSLISDKLTNNSETGKFSLNYGAILTSKLSEKISLRIGYNRIKLNTKINNIKSDTLGVVLSDSGIFLSNSIIPRINDQEFVSLTQKLDYHEISTELDYKLIDKKFDLTLIGGASLLVLQKNNITLHSDSDDFELGTNDNSKPVNISANIGTSLRYQLFDNIHFYVEPLIKYQLQKVSKNSDSYRPFYFTIQIGVSKAF